MGERINNTLWNAVFKQIWLPLSMTGFLLPELTTRIKQCILDLHYYRNFYTKMKQTSPTTKFMYNTSLEALIALLFDDEASNTEYIRNTILYGFPLKLQYHRLPLSSVTGKLLNDLKNEEDLTTLLANTSPKDRIMIHRTRYFPCMTTVK